MAYDLWWYVAHAELGIPLVNLTAVARRIKQQWSAGGHSLSGHSPSASSTLVYTNGELSNFLTVDGQPASASQPCANSLRTITFHVPYLIHGPIFDSLSERQLLAAGPPTCRLLFRTLAPLRRALPTN